jgi:hypothetical protein
VRIISLAALVLLSACVDLATVRPHKPITQGVFGEVVSSSQALEQNVEVDVYTMLNGMRT